jgi:L-2-hydroxyglutarate oxidase
MREIEPAVNGIKGIHVPEAGIVDFKAVCNTLVNQLSASGISVILNTKVIGSKESPDALVLLTSAGEIETKLVINCAGLYCDKLARILGHPTKIQIVPFRGEYYSLSPEAASLCKGLIYPVPNLDFPFLEVHLTKRISGEVECGPNAVLAYAREGYRKLDINPSELFQTLTYPGFQRLALRYYKQGLKEFIRSYSKTLFLKSLRKLVPGVQRKDLRTGGAGVRAQAVSPEGKLLDDFLIEQSHRAVHVLNAPSPAATSAFNIGQVISGFAAEALH